jgi:hypothetical protein
MSQIVVSTEDVHWYLKGQQRITEMVIMGQGHHQSHQGQTWHDVRVTGVQHTSQNRPSGGTRGQMNRHPKLPWVQDSDTGLCAFVNNG